MIDFNFQDFRVVDYSCQKIYACAQFKYFGYIISMSEIGVDRGGCPNECTVFFQDEIVFQGDTVQECIQWIHGNE